MDKYYITYLIFINDFISGLFVSYQKTVKYFKNHWTAAIIRDSDRLWMFNIQ